MCRQCMSLIKKQFVNDIIHRSALVNALESIKCPAMKALEELTPSGSEFWEDPDRCYKTVREQRMSTHRLLVQTVGQRNDLQRELVDVKKDLSFARKLAIKKHQELKELRRIGCMPSAPAPRTNCLMSDDELMAEMTGSWNTNLSKDDAQLVIKDINDKLGDKKKE